MVERTILKQIPLTHIRCCTCKKLLPVINFNKSKRRKTGFMARCKKCRFKHSQKPITKAKRKQYQTAWSKRNHVRVRELHRSAHLRLQFGLTLEQYDQMFELQNGVCFLCGRTEIIPGRRLTVDHNHETGKIRKLLCSRCNLFLGQVEKDIELVRKMFEYISEKL